jgi:hypothetical protein
MGRKKSKPPQQKRLSEQKYLIESASQILNQFDEQHAFLLISVLHECYCADNDMTLVQFFKMVAETSPSAHSRHFLKIESEYLKGA